jgi:hypothetical protein
MERVILVGSDDVLHGGRLAQAAGENMARKAFATKTSQSDGMWRAEYADGR